MVTIGPLRPTAGGGERPRGTRARNADDGWCMSPRANAVSQPSNHRAPSAAGSLFRFVVLVNASSVSILWCQALQVTTDTLHRSVYVIHGFSEVLDRPANMMQRAVRSVPGLAPLRDIDLHFESRQRAMGTIGFDKNGSYLRVVARQTVVACAQRPSNNSIGGLRAEAECSPTCPNFARQKEAEGETSPSHACHSRPAIPHDDVLHSALLHVGLNVGPHVRLQCLTG